MAERGLDDRVAAQIRVAGGRRTEADRVVGLADVRGGPVGVGEDGDGGQAHPFGRAQDTAGYLTAVGDQNGGGAGHAAASGVLVSRPDRRLASSVFASSALDGLVFAGSVAPAGLRGSTTIIRSGVGLKSLHGLFI